MNAERIRITKDSLESLYRFTRDTTPFKFDNWAVKALKAFHKDNKNIKTKLYLELYQAYLQYLGEWFIHGEPSNYDYLNKTSYHINHLCYDLKSLGGKTPHIERTIFEKTSQAYLNKTAIPESDSKYCLLFLCGKQIGCVNRPLFDFHSKEIDRKHTQTTFLSILQGTINLLDFLTNNSYEEIVALQNDFFRQQKQFFERDKVANLRTNALWNIGAIQHHLETQQAKNCNN